MTTKRVRLTIKQKIELLDKHASGQYTQMNLSEWAQVAFCLHKPLSQQNISDIISNRKAIYNNVIVKDNGKSLRLPRFPQLDEDIKKFVVNLNVAQRPVDRRAIIVYAKHIATHKYRISEGTINFSDSWLTKVLKRNNLKSRYIYGESASVDITTANIQNEISKIQNVLKDYTMENILNFDETGLYYEQAPR